MIDPTLMGGAAQGLAPGMTQQPMPAGAGPQVPPSQQPPIVPGQAPPMSPEAMMGMPPAPPEKAPPSLIPTDIARLLAESINNIKLEAAENLVKWLGDPRGTVDAKDADLVRVWRKRNPGIDPLYEKFINGLSDEEIMYAMYPARRALIRYGRRTFTEQVEFAEKMAKLDKDDRFDFMDEETEDEEEGYEPPTAEFPSKGENKVMPKDMNQED